MRAVLMYHSIDDSGSPISIAPDVFRRHVEWLASGAVRVLPLHDLLGESNVPGDEDAVALTFDDGFENFAEQAMPLLHANDLPATMFVVSGHVGGDNRWGGVSRPGIPVLPLMGWDTLASLPAHGITLGAHTRTHPHLSRLSRDAQQVEIEGSQLDLLTTTGQRATDFAYPFGDFDDTTATICRPRFECTVTTEYRALGEAEDPARVPRLDAWYFRQDGALESWGTASFRLRLHMRAGARRAKRLLRAD